MGFLHILASHPLLGRLHPSQLDLVCSLSREVASDRGRTVFEEGDDEIGIHLVIRGIFKMTRKGTGDRELLITLAGPGDLFGPCCQPVAPLRAACTARACERAKLVLLPAREWTVLLSKYPEVGFVFLQAMLASRANCVALGASLRCLRVESRLAKLLSGLARWGRKESDGSIEVPRCLSHAELATAVGASRQMITVRMAELTAAGLLVRRGRQVVIPNVEALAKRAET